MHRRLMLVMLLPAIIGAQTLRVDSSTMVGQSSPTRPLVEPHLAIDARNPQRLLAAAFVRRDERLPSPQGLNEQTCPTFLSEDAGRTWTRRELDATGCFDPWVAFTPNGVAVVTVIARHRMFPQQGDGGLLSYRSADGGVTWDTLPLGLGRNHDHTTMAVDVSQGPRRGWIYVSSHRGRSNDDGRYRYGVYVTRSRNGASSFDDPVWMIPNNLHNLAEMPVVLSAVRSSLRSWMGHSLLTARVAAAAKCSSSGVGHGSSGLQTAESRSPSRSLSPMPAVRHPAIASPPLPQMFHEVHSMAIFISHVAAPDAVRSS